MTAEFRTRCGPQRAPPPAPRTNSRTARGAAPVVEFGARKAKPKVRRAQTSIATRQRQPERFDSGWEGSDNHRLAVSEGARLHCDPGHPRPQVFDALSDGDTECCRIASPPRSDSKRLNGRFAHARHGIGGRSCLVRRYKWGFLAVGRTGQLVECDTDVIGRLNVDRLHPCRSRAHDILESVIKEDEC